MHIAICLLRFLHLFFKNFHQSFFFAKFGPIILSSTKWLKFRTGIDCCMLITILMFTFSKFLSVIFSGTHLVPKSNARVYFYMLITVLMCNFSKYFRSLIFGANFVPKSVVLHIYWNLAKRYEEHIQARTSWKKLHKDAKMYL